MRSSSAWLPCLGYAAVAVLGVTWAEQPPATLLAARESSAGQPDDLLRVVAGVGMAVLLVRLTVCCTRVLVERTQWARQLHTALRGGLLGMSSARMAVLSGLAALSEELFFRAALAPVVGIVASSALFGIAHLSFRGGQQLPLALWAFVMGLSFSGLHLLSGTLLAPILAHWLINYENMQYICGYDPTPLDMHRVSPRRGSWHKR